MATGIKLRGVNRFRCMRDASEYNTPTIDMQAGGGAFAGIQHLQNGYACLAGEIVGSN